MIARALAALAAAALIAGPAAAQGLQYVVSFEAPGDLAGVGLGTGLDTAFTCHGCYIREATDPAFPAHSGTHQVWATDFDIVVQDPFNISWPAMGAYVTGTEPVHADFYEYDYALAENRLYATAEVAGGETNAFLGLGFGEPRFLTLANFYSDAAFTLDDVTVGRTDVGPGIPEPASWALMVLGFGALGVAMRRRRSAFI